MGVQARGKNAIATAFPRKSLSLTDVSRWLGNVKSGAGSPTRKCVIRSSSIQESYLPIIAKMVQLHRISGNAGIHSMYVPGGLYDLWYKREDGRQKV